MKSKVIAGCVALSAAAWLAGCGDDNMSSAPAKPAAAPPAPAAPAAPATPPPAPAPAPVEAAKPTPVEAPKPAEPAKTVVQEAAGAVKAAAADAGSAVQKQLTDLATEVKGLIAAGKGTEALQRLTDGLKGLKLNPDQQKIVDGLKQQAQEALAKKGVESATKAVGDLLKPKTKN